jgi:hypothetical protein
VRVRRRRCCPVRARLAVSAVLLAPALVPAMPARAATGVVTLASHVPGSAVTTPMGASFGPYVSANGAFVLFTSTASTLVAGGVDENLLEDVYLFEPASGAVTLVSHVPGSTTTSANGRSSGLSISADGAFVTFQSEATDLVANGTDINATTDAYVYERATGAVTLVSHIPGEPKTTGAGFSGFPWISANGAWIAFESKAPDLVAGQIDTNEAEDVFVYDRATAAVTLLSRSATNANTTGNGASYAWAMSGDGASVAVLSAATNLVSGQNDTNGTHDVFQYARETSTASLVSHVPGSPTTASNGQAFDPHVSADGAFIAFQGAATNLVTGQSDINDAFDVFVYEKATGTVSLVSHASASATTASVGGGYSIAMSADGSVIGFVSAGTDLLAGQVDTFASADVFVYETGTAAVRLVTHAPGSSTAVATHDPSVGVLPAPGLSADGSSVAFMSGATNLVAGQTHNAGAIDLFVFDNASGDVSLLSRTPSSATTTTGVSDSFRTPISADGAVVAAQSVATNLVAGQIDENGTSDVFVFHRRPSSPAAMADFDGDARSDISVFRPASGSWLIRNLPTVFLGAEGDIPVPCDYDGDGATDAAVFRPSVGGWYIDGQAPAFFGLAGDVPIPGDYDGDGRCGIAVFRPSVGGWYVQGRQTVFFGLNGDIPVPGDYDGDGSTDVAVFRPSVGGWYRIGAATTFFGLSGDIPVPGDYDGNGGTDVAVFRPTVGGWYRVSAETRYLGLAGDLPQPGDYTGDGTTDLGVFRPTTGAWYIGNQGPAFHGTATDKPLPLPSAIRIAFSP